MRNTIAKDYFDWMMEKIYNPKFSPKRTHLLNSLFDRGFNYTADPSGMDINRFEDGISLRYRFGDERNIKPAIIASMLDTMPCTMLEMMVALALRIEESIMDNPAYGSRTGFWFWNMVDSLDLLDFTDKRFSETMFEDYILRFERREYCRNGRGGLFTIERTDADMRELEIWYQAMVYLEEYCIKTKEE